MTDCYINTNSHYFLMVQFRFKWHDKDEVHFNILRVCGECFSSPEHEVLNVNFCDRPTSVVRRASTVVHNFFKRPLLLHHGANLHDTWQGCSMGEALLTLFKRLNSAHNSGCQVSCPRTLPQKPRGSSAT